MAVGTSSNPYGKGCFTPTKRSAPAQYATTAREYPHNMFFSLGYHPRLGKYVNDNEKFYPRHYATEFFIKYK